jgi:putative membrane protein
MRKLNNLKFGLLMLYTIALIVSCIHPVYPQQMWLQHSATLLVGAFMIFDIKTNKLSNITFFCVFLFMIFHILGARWIYSYVPYDLWFQKLFGFGFNDFLGLQRNHYDRFVHFMFGVLMMIPFAEFYKKWFKVEHKIALHMAFMLVLASSLVYELFEWSLTILLTNEEADNYNGQQGDFWDAQKDMALAAIGGLLMYIYLKIKKHNSI